MALRAILFATLASKAALGATVAPRDHYYCTFFTEDRCRARSGSVNYAVDNPGIFQNGGPYFECLSSDQQEMSLISYPPGDGNGDHPNHCHVFTVGESAGKCTHLDDLGFTTGDGGYYRLSTDKTCPPLSKREEETADQPQNSNYLAFYDDPACEQQSGSVHYSTSNQGCFENGGAYAKFPGDDTDWHIEQYSGTDNYACTPSIEHCVHSDPFYVGGCVHLDSVGLSSGFGSYKIARHGCP